VLERLGAKVAAPIAVPLDAKDLMPYLAKVPADTQVLYSISRRTVERLLHPGQSMGLDQKMQRYSGSAPTRRSRRATWVALPSGVLPRIPSAPAQVQGHGAQPALRDMMEIDPGRRPREDFTAWWPAAPLVGMGERVLHQESGRNSGWKAKADNRVHQGARGMRGGESFEHPQGAKYIRPSDHKAVIDFKMSKVDKGEIAVIKPIRRRRSRACSPPRNDFSKESV